MHLSVGVSKLSNMYIYKTSGSITIKVKLKLIGMVLKLSMGFGQISTNMQMCCIGFGEPRICAKCCTCTICAATI